MGRIKPVLVICITIVKASDEFSIAALWIGIGGTPFVIVSNHKEYPFQTADT
jgi:hypothetical protein